MGVVHFATLSTGVVHDPLNSFQRHQRKLAHYQRMMARRVKGSQNWKKAKCKVQKIHARIANCRRDYLHKLSTTISKNHAFVVVEDLKVENMSKSAAGTIQNPGKNVRAKSGLNRSILDQGWGEFRQQLDYKLAWKGGWLLAVPPQNTSRTCPCFGHLSAENRKTQSHFECVKCGFAENADKVGALNVLARGYRVLACGEDVRPHRPFKANEAASVKQEPVEVTWEASCA